MTNTQDHFPSPRELMKGRRPQLFSDSAESPAVCPDARARLDYALGNIASNSQEHDFELFCTQLASRAICPNIRPQTGPTGGGDSKSDSTTYPVDSDLALRWYSGIPRQSPDARWAFAYSCKKDWATKVRLDVKGIVSVTPKPTEIYFLTSQPTSDKRRQEVESELLNTHAVTVHIMDRTWMLGQIEQHDWWFLSDYLKVALTSQTKRVIGPADAARRAELEALEARLADENSLSESLYNLSCDYLSAALLCRALELPRERIDGYFARALELAERAGSKSQQRWIAYNHAWTCFWWYEDLTTSVAHADAVLREVSSMDSPEELERAGNLLMLLRTLRAPEVVLPRVVEILGRSLPAHEAALRSIAANTARPLAAAYSKLLLATSRLHALIASENPAQFDTLLADLMTALEHADSLGAIPIGHYVEILSLYGEVAQDPDVYDRAMQCVLTKYSKRVEGSTRARGLVDRASQCLRQGDAKRALRLASNARLTLTGDFLQDGIRCAILMAASYEALGCLWASRAEYLFVLHSLTNNLPTGQKTPHMALRPAMQLCLVELQLGRPQCFLAARYLANLIANSVAPTEKEQEEILLHDVYLGISLVRASLEQTHTLCGLANALERLDLTFALACLHFAAGDTSTATRLAHVAPEETETFFQRVSEQPAAEQLPAKFLLNDNAPQLLHTSLRGVDFVVKCAPERAAAIFFSESLLTAIEAFLCLTEFRHLIFHVSRIQITVTLSQQQAFAFTESADGFDASLPTNATEWMTLAGGQQAADALLQLVIATMVRFSLSENVTDSLENLAKDGLFARVSIASSVPIMLSNLGLDRYHMLADWLQPSELSVSRTKPAILSSTPEARVISDEQVIHLISMNDWNAAKWMGVAYAVTSQGLLEIDLIFREGSGAARLFDNLKRNLGAAPKPDEALELLFLIDRPTSRYLIQIGPHVEAWLPSRAEPSHQFISLSRRLVMTISDTSISILENLASGSVNVVMLGAATMIRNEPLIVCEPIAVRSLRVIDSEHLPVDDKLVQSLVRDLRSTDNS